MNPMTKEIENDFLQYIQKMTSFQEALNLLYWDMRTGAPKKGIQQRANVVGVLSSELFQMSVSDEMASFIASLSPHEEKLSPTVAKILEECKKEYHRNKKIPTQEYKEYIILQSKAENAWEQAKEESRFELFRPYLEKIVEYKKRFIEYWGYKDHPYNTLLDLYEPGVTVDVLDPVFKKVRTFLVDFVSKIQKSPHKPKTDCLFRYFPKENQRLFSLQILKKMGYDLEAGRLDETIHPFEIALNPGDVRVTTHYNEKDFRVAIFGTIHEGGHAIYEQNIRRDLIGTPLCAGTSMGIHESQSLFYENFIGRHRHFWKKHFDLLKRYSNGQFDTVSTEEFYRAVNEVKPGLIRIEADECTYLLHIIIRYEIEKALFQDEIQVKDLPEVWNLKYKEYLGVSPQNDGEGVLQDIHWAGGDFGYFPSYGLGLMYAAQFYYSMKKDLPDFEGLLETGQLIKIKEWLNQNVHQYGKLKKPLEILMDATGEELNPEYFIRYIRNKYTDIYRL
ncbi:carboxypeptidase M32 [Bacillus smithii]|uniref:carboxypeptidase M32 n=1 Tax=Bacillus smithii TaxID=1479 RepID=UPI0030C9094F